ncbi:peptidylprolyl isomerase [Sphingomonas nostoxanthinifaciens]|uniref:peptidylprolyl isomerase n=1 Tax=Sphingomonas nostoxanthinifaciens TaxID=2872652 RepID=UPI0021D855E5|nr:peptidylprolyl isomerase [Sphingomonas nostoxanthinifaciens]
MAILGLILIAFLATGIGTPGGSLTGGPAPNAVATVGGTQVTVQQVGDRVQGAWREASQQQPGLTVPAFLDAIGGIGPIVEQYIGATVLGVWAQKHGITANERLIGAEIAAIPAFQGPTGQFDQKAMNAMLGQRRMSFATLHDGIRDDLIRRQLVVPITTGVQTPTGLLNPYAMLLIDRREGAVGAVEASTAGIAAPTDAEVANWYKSYVARYSLPERRVVRYALLGPEQMTAAAPTDAEIAAAYKADAAKYAASETRTLSQVVLPGEAQAKAFAAKVSGGTPFAKAAADAGFAAADISLGDLAKDALAKSASPAVADAAFALPANGTTAPIKTALGFTIAHVDAIKRTAAKTLDQAKPEIVAALAKKKGEDALGTRMQAIQDQLTDGANFNDIVAKQKLSVITTPPVLANGTVPTDPAFKPDATLTALMKPAAQATAEDAPTLETIDPTHFALLSVASVVPAAPLPLAEVKARVAQDIVTKRAVDRAYAQAQAILAKVQGGQPLAAAMAAAGLHAPQTIATTQVELSRAGPNVPAPVRTLFRLTAGKSDLAPGPAGSWYVVHLDRIVPGDPAMLAPIVSATRGELGRNLSEEYAQQFAAAARQQVKVTRNPAAIGQLDAQLRGRAPQGQ